jgi:undecaprenyl-diphosphatase
MPPQTEWRDLGGLAAGLGTFLIVAFAIPDQGPGPLDETLLDGLRTLRSPPWTSFMWAVSAVTRGVVLGAVTVLAMVPLWHWRRGAAVFVGIAVGGSGGLNQLMKQLWARPRPPPADAVYVADNYAFPSGHAMISIAFALAFWMVFRSARRRVRQPLAAGAIAAVGVVGLSRVYLGVHYPSDVLGGWALGAAWVLAVHLGWTLRRRDSGREPASPCGP